VGLIYSYADGGLRFEVEVVVAAKGLFMGRGQVDKKGIALNAQEDDQRYEFYRSAAGAGCRSLMGVKKFRFQGQALFVEQTAR
jgi:hypothetical protein